MDMGAGPLRLTSDRAISDELREQGWDVQLETIDTPDPNDPEIVRIAEGDRRLARRVHAAHEGGAFPLVLAGNCNSCLGTVAGVGPVGVVWFDAHADFDTPDRSLGFFDGMGLAILTGNGWELLRRTIPGFTPVDERDVVLVGVRDLEEHPRRSRRPPCGSCPDRRSGRQSSFARSMSSGGGQPEPICTSTSTCSTRPRAEPIGSRHRGD